VAMGGWRQAIVHSAWALQAVVNTYSGISSRNFCGWDGGLAATIAYDEAGEPCANL
jgi:hypothetical protein